MTAINPRTFVLLFAVLALLTSGAIAGEAEPNTLRLGLGGYSPVSYFNGDGPKPGSPTYSATHEGVTYFFQSDAERRTFDANPGKYVPAYGGWCAFGMAVEGRFDADPTNYKIVDGKLNVFKKTAELDTLKLWNEGDGAQLQAKAEAYWRSLKDRPSRAYLHSRNVSADGVAIDGYSPVSYFTKGYAELGSPDFAVEHGGVTYLLVDAEQAEMFKADPDKYVPAYGGWCAFGMSVQDKFPVDPKAFKVEDGKLLLFLRNEGVDARELWNKGNAKELTKKAEAHWKKVAG